jgi:hypothetical protein
LALRRHLSIERGLLRDVTSELPVLEDVRRWRELVRRAGGEEEETAIAPDRSSSWVADVDDIVLVDGR